MRILSARDESVAACRAAAGRGTLGFVPTMGSLHDGHLALVTRARAECDSVAASIFVNPLQFGPHEDFDAYPRDEARDAELCDRAGVDLLLLLQRDEMYPPGFATTVTQAGHLTGVLEGAERPGHFDGVLTVVAKLFGIVGPSTAYFGRKDYQQTVVVRRMIADLELPIELVVVDTVRESDGLARSSRNAYLGPELRPAALSLVAALTEVERRFEAGERDAAALAGVLSAIVQEGTGGRLDYAQIVDADLGTPRTAQAGQVAVVAARVGPARLLDNHVLGRPLGPFA